MKPNTKTCQAKSFLVLEFGYLTVLWGTIASYQD